MSALANLEERIAKLETAAEDIRAATREAHEATRDLRAVEKAVRGLLATDARALVDEAVGEHVKTGLAEYDGTIRAAMDKAVEKVAREFDRLADLYLHGEKGTDEPSLPELAERTKQKRRRTR